MLITSLAGGGAERVASELSLHLGPQIQRQIVTLINRVSYPSNKPPLSLNFNSNSPKVLGLLWVLLFGTLKYRRLLNDHKPDISMSFLVLDNFINILASFGKKRVKTVLQVHIALSMKFQHSILDTIAKHLITILYNRADLIIAVSEGVKQELIQEFNIRQDIVKVIYNPNDTRKIESLIAEHVDDEWFNEDIPIIFNLGRLTEQKGQWHLIRAFAKIRKQINCRLVIRGDGDLKLYLNTLINEMGLNDDVRFLGWVDNPYKYIAKSSLFVSSSLWEALPYSLVEALACGCPIISTDCKYGPREILADGRYGILIPEMDNMLYGASDPLTKEEELLAQKIVELIENDTLREKYRNLGKIRARDFDWEQSIEKYEKILCENCA
jgi:glycosyltransferase involved in cell wall biosynthesis